MAGRQRERTLFDDVLSAGEPPERLSRTRGRPNRESTVADKQRAKRTAWDRLGDSITTTHHLYLGDARRMEDLLAPPAPQIHLVVTSPPYWNLKQYAADRGGAQLGHIDDRDVFLNQLNEVWKRCLDLLVAGGRMCIVVGDVCRSRRKHGRHVVEPLHSHLLVECQKLGFDPLAPIIWKKIANATTEVEGNAGTFLGKPYEPNAIIKNDLEYVLLFRKAGGYRHPTKEQRALSVIEKADYAVWFQQVWDDVPGQQRRGHPAPFPKEIARRLIGMFSFVGDTVLDPFCGIGTTTLAAMDMYRSSIGIEIEPQYLALARKRLRAPPPHARVHIHEP